MYEIGENVRAIWGTMKGKSGTVVALTDCGYLVEFDEGVIEYPEDYLKRN